MTLIVNKERPVQLFRPSDERYSLWLPFIFLLPIVVYYVWFGCDFNFNRSSRALLFGLASSVLLSSAHVGFTFSTIYILPEARIWIEARFGDFRRFWLFFGLLMVVFLPIFLFAAGLVGSTWAIAPFAPWVFRLNGVLLNYHALGQSKGLSLLYNRKILADENLSLQRMVRIRRHESVERWGFLALVCVDGLSQLGANLGLPKSLGMGNGRFYHDCFIAEWLIVGAILIAQVTMPLPRRGTKLVFLGRLLLWPLTMYSFLAYIGTLVIHGFEYLFVNRKISERIEKSKVRAGLFFFAATFVLSLLLSGGFIRLAQSPVGWTQLSALATAILASLTVFHIAWDRLFYKMKSTSGEAVALSVLK